MCSCYWTCVPFVRHYELTGKDEVIVCGTSFPILCHLLICLLFYWDICCFCVHQFASGVCASVSTVPVFDSVFVFLLITLYEQSCFTLLFRARFTGMWKNIALCRKFFIFFVFTWVYDLFSWRVVWLHKAFRVIASFVGLLWCGANGVCSSGARSAV